MREFLGVFNNAILKIRVIYGSINYLIKIINDRYILSKIRLLFKSTYLSLINKILLKISFRSII